VDGDAGCGVEPADTPNESDALIIELIVLESPNGGGILRVHLGSPSWHAGDVNGPGNRVDASRGQADESRGLTDALNTSNNAETAGISCDEGAGAYLGAGGAKHIINVTVGIGSHTDASDRHRDVPSIQTHAIIPTNTPETVSTPQKRPKPPDSPSRDVPNVSGSHADASTAVETHASLGAHILSSVRPSSFALLSTATRTQSARELSNVQLGTPDRVLRRSCMSSYSLSLSASVAITRNSFGSVWISSHY